MYNKLYPKFEQCGLRAKLYKNGSMLLSAYFTHCNLQLSNEVSIRSEAGRHKSVQGGKLKEKNQNRYRR